jgi:hypothetical protein
VLDIFFVDVLHTKIVNNKGKADRAPVATPISWAGFALSVPGFVETFGEEFFVQLFRLVGGRTSVIGHGMGGKYIPIMAHLTKARHWSKR